MIRDSIIKFKEKLMVEGIVMICQKSEVTEEAVVELLQQMQEKGLYREFAEQLEQGFVEAELYLLAKIVHTHIEYNFSEEAEQEKIINKLING